MSEYYRSWGFTIYRTAYGPATDAQWRILLDKIRTQAVSEVDGYVETGEEDVAAQLKSVFVLDARSDAALLADKTMDESLPVMHDEPNQRAFLLADDEVLEGVNRDPYFWVKCVEADFVERCLSEADRDTGARGRGRTAAGTWSGWMKMTTRSVVDLCAEMLVRDLASIAPGARAADERSVYNGELTGSSLTSKMSSGK
ncbi:hypothetical protein K4K52_001541 [Colletotrichum sp. SAR 10_76]|nr:hypothetical protein K4K52_001541 [Colletotrichum sp. SAR 10_76]